MIITKENKKITIKLNRYIKGKFKHNAYLYDNFFDYIIDCFWDKNIDITFVNNVWYLADSEECKIYLLTSDLSELENQIAKDKIRVCYEIIDVKILNQIYFSKCLDK